MVAPMLMQIQTRLMQAEVWRYAGFASAVVGLLCYALSSSFNYLFGEWNLLKIFLFVVFSFIICVVILFANVRQHSRSHRFKAHIAFLLLTITSVYSFFFDKVVNGKPDAYSLISCAAFAIMSLSLSRQTQCGFEVDLLYFFLGCLIVQLMRIELPLGIVGVGFSYSLIILRSSFSSMDAAAPDNEYPGLPDDNSVVLDVDSLQLASTDIASSMMEQLSRLPAAGVNGGGYFQDAGRDAMPGPVSRWARPVSEWWDAVATKLQKVYKSYRTRRNLANCADVVEELRWKALDFAALKRSSVSFFNVQKPETAVSRWARARARLAKVGKGLSKDDKAQKLALQHWLEAIDPRHRYGHNLHMYYDIWFKSQSTQPFFYWLDVGDGKEINLEKCPRGTLQRQRIKYLGPKGREEYEVTVKKGRLVYRQDGWLVDTDEKSKWIFVLSTTRALYVGRKQKGTFEHSSFLAGGATIAAGRLLAHQGVLEAICPYSGHYHPTEDNFKEFISFLVEHNVDLTNVKVISF